MLNSTWPSAWLAFTITLAFAIWPVMFIAYVEFKSMISALERFSFAVIVMFRVSPKVASEVLWALLLYMVRFERVGFVQIYCNKSLDLSGVTARLFSARSNAVMLNKPLLLGWFHPRSRLH